MSIFLLSRFDHRTFLQSIAVVALVSAATILPGTAFGADSEEKEVRYSEIIDKHFAKFLEIGVDKYGDDQSALWIASVDLDTGGQNEDVSSDSRRAYRRIHAPRGSNLYWDVPLLVAAYRTSELTGNPKAGEGADACVEAFLERCVSPQNGLFLWGNHLFYNVFTDKMEKIGHPSYEVRPSPVPWGVTWRHSPEKTAQCIRSMGKFHIIDQETGFFDRHARSDKTENKPTQEYIDQSYPFLESGGVIVESLAWLAAKNPPDRDELIETALRVAKYSLRESGEKTGLIRNQNHRKRWDYVYSTTEVGLWAGDLLRAAELTGDDRFAEVAESGLRAYLKHGWDAGKKKYYGALKVDDASFRKPEEEKPYPYQPDRYSDIWEPLFPIHDYPMAMAEACLAFYERSGRDEYREGVKRWADHVAANMPARYLSERNAGDWIEGAYAANYGAAIHFLSRASKALDDPSYRELAEKIADDAMDKLYISEKGVFRSHPGDNVADTIDGLGVLFLAMLELETGADGDLMGYHF